MSGNISAISTATPAISTFQPATLNRDTRRFSTRLRGSESLSTQKTRVGGFRVLLAPASFVQFDRRESRAASSTRSSPPIGRCCGGSPHVVTGYATTDRSGGQEHTRMTSDYAAAWPEGSRMRNTRYGLRSNERTGIYAFSSSSRGAAASAFPPKTFPRLWSSGAWWRP